MADTINDGGPAFPVGFQKDDFIALKGGMTMRDYFAAKALAAIVGNESKAYENCGKPGVQKIANWAYEFADAMLKARDGQC